MAPQTAVVLAGGEGQRLRPLTRNRPKPMLPAANRPIIEYVLDAIIEAGISDIHLVVGYKRQRVQSHFGPTYQNADLTYHTQEKQLGSGHALLQARDEIDEPFVAINGDQIADPALITDVLDAHDRNEPAATLSVVDSGKAAQYGVVTLEAGHVTHLREQPRDDSTGALNAGIYAFTPGIFEVLDTLPRPSGMLSLTAAISHLAEETEQTVQGVKSDGFWIDATFPWDLLAVARQVYTMEWINEPAVDSHVWVAESATVHPSATLKGPVVVGPDAEIGAGAVVGPAATIGGNATVGANAVLTNALIDDGSRVGANATVVDAIFGQDVVFGPNSVIAGGEHDVRIDTQVYPNHELGAVIADRSQLGGGTTVCGGVLIGSGVQVQDGERIETNVADGVELR
ncbi:sugar phosphate nucleotidyltransferase [Halorubrum sp. GN11GM_10-3_MGM]|uniref:sugar phosphate nucleotidyltransferase n=1 Tax=Halorubrum sp. GN11GM_10-3_MGM TaxID=2518111 RepID=UPI0010F59F33|nr:sugar phosphate nucleotidyltransferase [Halorubrum sp. GN11GM_10-3_MGM]TKX72453.1 nucleotidyl transferase [Halorubrum sp. GN11GM_10-3_MGM]